MAGYFLSPHRVARYFFHECDRYLRYTATPKNLKGEEEVPPYELDHSLLTKATLESWEEKVLATYLGGFAVIASPPDGNPNAAKTACVHSVDATLDALKNAVPGQYIYQPTIAPTPGFYVRYGVDTDLLAFTDCRPDLLKIDGTDDGSVEITVLDLKATDETKLAHRIQATLYSLILESLLEDHGIDGLRISGKGGVWLYKKDAPDLFDLVQVRPPLETYLAHELQPILRKPASEAFWHLYCRCEWCDFYQALPGSGRAIRRHQPRPFGSAWGSDRIVPRPRVWAARAASSHSIQRGPG